MKRKARFPRHVLHSFLHLAAAALALGGDIPAALADSQFQEQDERPEERREQDYQHRFTLKGEARIRLLDGSDAEQLDLKLHGTSMVGPLAHGAYTLLISRAGLTDSYRLRIGPDTLPYLYFSTPS